MQTELIHQLTAIGVIQKGNFVLRSGEESQYYCDIKKAFGNPEVLADLANALYQLIPKGTTALAALGYGGIPIATALSLKSSLPLCLVRDAVKDHGTQQQLDGYVPTKSDVVAIVDDVCTTGSSVRDTLQKLAPIGCGVNAILVIAQRGDVKMDIPVHALITDADLFTV